jgi:hypothetical protein
MPTSRPRYISPKIIDIIKFKNERVLLKKKRQLEGKEKPAYDFVI